MVMGYIISEQSYSGLVITDGIQTNNRPFAKMAAFKLFFCSYPKEPH